MKPKSKLLSSQANATHSSSAPARRDIKDTAFFATDDATLFTDGTLSGGSSITKSAAGRFSPNSLSAAASANADATHTAYIAATT